MTVRLDSIPDDTAESRHATDALIAIDLSSLGISAEDSSAQTDVPAEHVNFPALASACDAALSGGVDVVALSKDFFAHSYTKARDGNLDPAKIASQLMKLIQGWFSAEIPATVRALDKAADWLVHEDKGWSSVEVLLESNSDLGELRARAEQAHSRGLAIAVRMRADIFTDEICEEVASWADAVRLETDDAHTARKIRSALRSAATNKGRDLKVVCEMGILISASTRAARERELLLSIMRGTSVFPGKAHVVGTVYDVADEAERWISQGAVDGLVFLPASVPTDLASLIRGVLPLLRAREIEND